MIDYIGTIFTIRSEYNQVMVHYIQFIIIYYVTEHQLSHIIDAFHTMPTTRVNQGPKLLKLIGWRYCPRFRWVLYIPGPRLQLPGTEPGPTVR